MSVENNFTRCQFKLKLFRKSAFKSRICTMRQFRDLLWLMRVPKFQIFKLIELLLRSGDGHIERSPLQDRDWEPAPVEMRQTSPDPVEKKEMKKLPVPRTRKTRQVPDDNPVEQV